MRLIDADELKTAFPVCDNSKPVLIASVRATINHMPTIEPQRKTGKWINVNGNDEVQRCSECNYQLLGKKYHDMWMNVPYNFCPNCGAMMRIDE